MIINWYILRQIHLGSLLALIVLVSLALFGLFIAEVSDVGQGEYDMLHVIGYMTLRIPSNIVEYLPLAVLLGTMLSLGGLASNSEIIAMQAAGVSLRHLLIAVFQAAVILAVGGFVISDWVAPISETSARQMKAAAINDTAAIRSKKGIWIKDNQRVVHIGELLPNGIARAVQIFQFNEQGHLQTTIIADSAIPFNGQWRLKQVKKTTIEPRKVSSETSDELLYSGRISNQVLDALLIESRQMSSFDLYNYRNFLLDNNLDASVESLIFWQKIFAPLVVLVMCFLAVPFVLGSQRQSNTGQRLIYGILLGLAFSVMSRLLVQLGTQLNFSPMLNALAPIVIFFLLAIYLLIKKQTHVS